MAAEPEALGAPSQTSPAPAEALITRGEAIIVSATGIFTVGELVTVHRRGEPWALLSVVEVRQAEGGTPHIQGNVFLKARLRILALADQVQYSQVEFQPFVEGEATDQKTPGLRPRRPTLTSGTLQRGHVAEGWLVFEVPATGQVVLGYGGNTFIGEPPYFEVVLRET